MLAILGHMITTAGNRLPGDIAFGVPFSSVKSGLAAFDAIPAAGSLQLVSTLLHIIYPIFFSLLPTQLNLILLPIQLLFVGAIEYGFSRVQKSIEEDCSQYMDGLGWSAEKQGKLKNTVYTMDVDCCLLFYQRKYWDCYFTHLFDERISHIEIHMLKNDTIVLHFLHHFLPPFTLYVIPSPPGVRHQSGCGAKQWPRSTDGNPRPHGARKAKQRPLYH